MIESGEVAASLAELVSIQATFAAEGIEFTNDDGFPASGCIIKSCLQK
jgi:hypothetical protein